MKKLLSLIITIIFLILITTSVFAYNQTDYFVDNSGLCLAEDVHRINEFLGIKSQELSFNISALIEESINGEDIQDYADLYYEDKFGYDSDGILFVLVLDTREWAFSSSGKGISIFNEIDYDELMNSMYSYLRAGEYSSAIEAYAYKTSIYVEWVNENAYNITDEGYYYYPTDNEYEPKEKSIFDSTRLIWSSIIGCISGLIGVSSMKNKMNTVHKKSGAYNYVRNNSLVFTRSDDMFLNKSVARTLKQTQRRDSSSSFHSSGTTHISSSGHSHGGSHGHF